VVTIIDNSDPLETWSEFEPWLRRQVAAEAVANVDYLTGRTDDLAQRVAEMFGLDSGPENPLSLSAPLPILERIEMGPTTPVPRPRRAALILATARSTYGGMLMFGAAGTLLGVPIMGPVAAAVGFGVLGRWAMREERRRQLAQRRQDGRDRSRQYLDEALFVLSKDCRDALRRAQRQLRDDFTVRARAFDVSKDAVLATAQRAMRLTPEQRSERTAAVAAELHQIEAMERDAAPGPGPSAAGTVRRQGREVK